MKKQFLLSLLFVVISSAAQAQSITYEAFTISELVMDMNWENMAPALEIVIKQTEANLKEAGATERAAKVITSSVRDGYSRNAISRLMAESMSKTMSQEEQKETLAFIQTSAGKKFVTSLNSQSEISNDYVVKLFKSSCDRANQELGFFDKGSIKKICEGFKQ